MIRPADSAALAISILILHPSIILSARAQGTAFTYQARLHDGANPANGLYDLRFTIYDSTNVPGTLIAGPLTSSATGVSNGLFAVMLEFGPGVFTGANRWLDIAVRTNGGAGFSRLNPRQQLTPIPYAICAFGANAAGLSGTIPPTSLSGTYGNAVNFTNANNTFAGNGGG